MPLLCDARGASLYRDLDARADYDRETLRLLEPFLPDLMLLDGYLYLVTPALLGRFRNRVLNLHFSDLTLRTIDGRPRFPGLRAVRDALADGRGETRATVHLVNDKPDDGPPIVRSWPFPVSPLVEELRSQCADDMFKAYVFAHEQWMMRTVSGPVMAAAFELIAAGAVDLDALAASQTADAPWTLDRSGCLRGPGGAGRMTHIHVEDRAAPCGSSRSIVPNASTRWTSRRRGSSGAPACRPRAIPRSGRSCSVAARPRSAAAPI